MRQAALAGGIVHVAGIDKGGVAEDRRLGPLADDEREPVGQHLGGDSLLEALQILGVHAAAGSQRPAKRPEKQSKTGEKLDCIQPPYSRRTDSRYLLSSKLLPATGCVNRRRRTLWDQMARQRRGEDETARRYNRSHGGDAQTARSAAMIAAASDDAVAPRTRQTSCARLKRGWRNWAA